MSDLDDWNLLLSEYRSVVGVELVYDHVGRSLNLSLRLAKGDLVLNSPDLLDQVHFHFEKVNGLIVRAVGSGPLFLPVLRIRDVRDLGWEDVRFEVEELEHRTIFFRCSSIVRLRAVEE